MAAACEGLKSLRDAMCAAASATTTLKPKSIAPPVVPFPDGKLASGFV